MTKNVFFDLDGTLIDCRIRLYNLFQELVPKSKFYLGEYWEIKRKRINQKKLLSEWFSYSDTEIREFNKLWLAKVEEDERLVLDVPFENASELLERVSPRYNLYIVTNRQNPQKAIKQVKAFGWDKYLNGVLVTGQKQTKTELINENVETFFGDMFVGDTGEDILTGKELGMKTIAVSSGFLNEEMLKEYNPDLIVENVKEIYENNML